MGKGILINTKHQFLLHKTFSSLVDQPWRLGSYFEIHSGQFILEWKLLLSMALMQRNEQTGHPQSPGLTKSLFSDSQVVI